MSEPTSGHTSRAKDPAIVREAQKPIEFISGIFVTIAIGFVVLGLVLGIRGCRAETKARADTRNCENSAGDWVKTPAGHYRGGDGKCVAGSPPPPPPPRTLAPAERPWTSRTFDVPATGLRFYLYAGSARYPKLGGVLTHTSSGKSYVDLPGVDHDGMNNPDGWFTFLPDPPGSVRKIEIYNRW